MCVRVCSPIVTGLKSKLTSPSPCNSICPSARPLGDYRVRERGRVFESEGDKRERGRAKIERNRGGTVGNEWQGGEEDGETREKEREERNSQREGQRNRKRATD